MIKYEDILKIIDPIFVSTVNIITWDKFNEFVDTLNKKNCIHIHTKWAVDFYRSEYFSKNNNIDFYKLKLKDLPQHKRSKVFDQSAFDCMNKLADLELNLSQLSLTDTEKFIVDSLPIHTEIFSLGMNWYRSEFQYLSRFPLNKIRGFHIINEYNETLQVYDIIKKYNKTKILNLGDNQQSLRESWNRMLGVLWGFAEVGVGDKIIDIIDTLLEFHLLLADGILSDEFFNNIDQSISSPRRRMALLFIKSCIYNQMGLINKRVEVLQEIINLHSTKTDRAIRYYVGVNRLTEAALSLYKIDPNKENKDQVLKFYNSIENPNVTDHLECPRERALVTFQIAKTFGYVE